MAKEKEQKKGRGRPTKYKKRYATKDLEKYLESCKDKVTKKVVQENKEKGYTMYKEDVEIKLPTIEGFAIFIKVPRRTIYEWIKVNPEFAVAMDSISALQKQVLIQKGLEGKYNPSIARLILSTNHGMRESTDLTSGGEKIGVFNDDQVNRIADRIARRRAKNGDTPSES